MPAQFFPASQGVPAGQAPSLPFCHWPNDVTGTVEPKLGGLTESKGLSVVAPGESKVQPPLKRGAFC